MSHLKSIASVLLASTFSIGAGNATPLPTIKAKAVPDTVKNPQAGEVIVKCAGIAAKGKNHCGANGHDCTGLSAKDDAIKDFDPNEWIYVRPEVCAATPGKVVGKKKVTS